MAEGSTTRLDHGILHFVLYWGFATRSDHKVLSTMTTPSRRRLSTIEEFRYTPSTLFLLVTPCVVSSSSVSVSPSVMDIDIDSEGDMPYISDVCYSLHRGL